MYGLYYTELVDLLAAYSSLLRVQTDLCTDTSAGWHLITVSTPALALLSALN